MSDKKNSSSTCMPDNHTRVVKSQKSAQSDKLVLDEDNFRPTRSRGDLYKELTKGEREKTEEDYYDFSSPIQRGLGLVIDAAFLFGIYKLIVAISPLELTVVNYFLGKYKLQFMFGDKALAEILKYGTIFFALIFAVVIPAAFFNSSLGKKVTGQRIRGDEKYTLSISQAFCRELIWKPLSIGCLVGFILPFFDKKKKSLHDKISGTFIIKD